MTICIGAICDDHDKVILASDRMITASYPSIEFEHALPKMEKLSNSCVALTAGSALAHTELFKHTKTEINEISNPSISLITKNIKEKFVAQRVNRAEELFLKPRGLNLDMFYQNQSMLAPDTIIRLDSQISSTILELEILVCGIDEEGCHVHYILDPGISECYDSLGYCAIGSGAIHAMSNFIFNDFSPLMPLNKAIYTVFEGKKIAESSPGVGTVTDMVLLTHKGITELTEHDLSILNEMYIHQQNMTKPENDGMEELNELSIINK